MDNGHQTFNKNYRVILILAIITLSLFFLISLKPVFALGPTAEDDPDYIASEDIELLIPAPGVADNDTGDALSLTVIKNADPLTGSLVLAPTGAFTYTPELNFNGIVTFTYHLTDDFGTSAPATVTITVNALNDAPVVVDDGKTTAEDTAVATNVLLNDSDVDGNLDLTTVSVITAPQNGTTEVNPLSGIITYTPNLNFNGSDSFGYQVFDDGSPLPALSATATVYLTVTAVNDAPIAGDDLGGPTPEDTALNVDAPGVLANDNDSADSGTVSIDQYDASSAQGGDVTLNADGSYSYDPAASTALNALAVGESIIDTFQYTIVDTGGLTATAVVSITVTGVNDPPNAVDDDNGATTDEDNSLFVSAPGVLLGDSDPDTSDTLSAVIDTVTSAQGATVTINSSGSYDFDPTSAAALQSLAGGDSIFDTFTYSVIDGNGGLDTAVVTVTVTGVNDAPVLDNSGNLTLSTIAEDTTSPSGNTVNAIILSGGGDPISDFDDLRDGIAVTNVDNTNGTWEYSINGGANWTAFSSPSGFNALLLDASGTDATRIRFVPDPDYNGSASITFRAWDQTNGYSSGQTDNVIGNGGSTPYSSATELAIITVSSVNDAPVLDNSGTMVLPDLLEDPAFNNGDTVVNIISSAGNDRITDVDAGAVEGIAVIGIDNTNGFWQFRTETGSWQNLNVSSTSATLLAELDRVRFVPQLNYNGPAGLISFRAWDQTTGASGNIGIDVSNNGGTTAFSTAVETATLTVWATNDAPVLDLNGSSSGVNSSATFTEDGGPKTIVDTDLSVSDIDNTQLSSATASLNIIPDGAAEVLAVTTLGNILANYNSTSGVLTLSGVDDITNYQTVLRSLTYNNTSQNPNTTGRLVEVVVNDGNVNSAPATSFVTIHAQNDPPILATNDTLWVNEGGTGTISVARLLVTDVDNDDPEIIFTVIAAPANGQLFLNTLPLNVNGSFTQADINNSALKYTHDGSETTSDNFNFTVSDSAGGAIGTTPFTISINGNNDEPVLATNNGITVNEAATKIITSADLLVTDTDNTNVQITYRIESLPGNGTLKLNGSPIGLNGAFTQDDINNNRIAYTHDGSETTSDSFDFSVEDGVGGSIASTPFAIVVNPVNDAPAVDLNGTAVGQNYNETFVEDGGPVSIVATELSITDPDSPNLISARVSLTNRPNGTAESLSVTTSGTSITANYNPATGILALSGVDTKDHYQTVLRSLQYNNTSQDPSTSDRLVTIMVNDGSLDSNTATSTVDITAINDPLLLTANTGLTIAYAQNKLITSAELLSTDVDNTATELVYTLQSVPANGWLKLNGIPLAINGTFTQNDINNNRLSYEHDKSNTESDSFSFTLADGEGGFITTRSFDIVIGAQPVIFLPTILNNYVYSEPNDTACDAFAVNVGQSYQFLPDDQEDWYKFTIGSTGPITVKVSNYGSPDGQLLVYSGNCSSLNIPAIGHDPSISPSGSISFPSLSPGTYYVRVYTAVIPSNPFLYTLTVSRP